MTTTDEEILQAAREACAIAAEELGLRTSASEYRKAKGWYGFEVRTAACAIRSERARTQAIAAAGWEVGRGAVLVKAADLAGWEPGVGQDGEEREWAVDLYELRGQSRALTPPAEFTAPEDKRGAEITRLRAQVSERDALLRDMRKAFAFPGPLNAYRVRIDALLKTETTHD